MATLLVPGQPPCEVKPADVSFTLEELQGLVGGLIEHVVAADGRDLIINEEGKLLGMEPNHQATQLWLGGVQHDDVLVGPVVVCEEREFV